MTIDTTAPPAHGHGHDAAHHNPHLAHHFDTPQQQFDSAKLGIWLFLATEILLFGGLFCAYSIYRSTHPEIFAYGHKFLDVKMGGINTIVLICSSLTMAWAVRCAQLGQRGRLILLLFLTLACAGGFMGIKYVEYTHKIHSGLLWGTHYRPNLHDQHAEHAATAHEATDSAGHDTAKPSVPTSAGAHAPTVTEMPGAAVDPNAPDLHPDTAIDANASSAHPLPPGATPHGDGTVPAAGAGAAAGAGVAAAGHAPPSNAGADRSLMADAAQGPAGLAAPVEVDPHALGPSPKNVQIFFGIYFLMTGLHGIHVLAGMVCITWLIIGSFKNKYGPDYFTPVDLVGLYWHIVDLIWIFLFPLLYLIH